MGSLGRVGSLASGLGRLGSRDRVGWVSGGCVWEEFEWVVKGLEFVVEKMRGFWKCLRVRDRNKVTF